MHAMACNGMLSLARRSRGPQGIEGPVQDISSHTRGNRSRNNVFRVFTSVVIFCFAFNLRLHSIATAVVSNRWSEISDPRPSRVVVGKIRATAEGQSSDGSNSSEPTLSPTTATWSPTTHTWSPTAQNQRSWLPTEHELSSNQNHENERSYGDERPAAHPRVACFIHNDINNDSSPNEKSTQPEAMHKLASCYSVTSIPPKMKKRKIIPSIPLEEKSNESDKEDAGAEDEDAEDENDYHDTETCKYPDPAQQGPSIAPPTCNDIHSLGFDSHMFQNQHRPSDRSPIQYITMGGAKCIWKVSTLDDKHEEETVIFKSNKNSRFLKRQFYEQSRRDALISGRAGNALLSRSIESKNGIPINHSSWNHILPMYHYCALANIVPYANGKNLMEFIQNDDTDDNDRRFGPMDTLHLALQAARGLYQAQLYWDGKPTFVHADLNPSQFLVFIPYSDESDKKLPILQINDFNQGRFLTRSVINNEICPFRVCSKNQRGNRYHTPERFTNCVDQNEGIDIFSLGGVFFFLLTNGFDPYYDVRNYMPSIKKGELPHIPSRLDLDHPAYDALRDIMIKCMTAKLSDRPSSLEVVYMLEEKLQHLQ